MLFHKLGYSLTPKEENVIQITFTVVTYGIHHWNLVFVFNTNFVFIFNCIGLHENTVNIGTSRFYTRTHTHTHTNAYIYIYIRLGLPRGLFAVGLPVKILKALLPYSILAT